MNRILRQTIATRTIEQIHGDLAYRHWLPENWKGNYELQAEVLQKWQDIIEEAIKDVLEEE